MKSLHRELIKLGYKKQVKEVGKIKIYKKDDITIETYKGEVVNYHIYNEGNLGYYKKEIEKYYNNEKALIYDLNSLDGVGIKVNFKD